MLNVNSGCRDYRAALGVRTKQDHFSRHSKDVKPVRGGQDYLLQDAQAFLVIAARIRPPRKREQARLIGWSKRDGFAYGRPASKKEQAVQQSDHEKTGRDRQEHFHIR
jgi:hypothetical protein